MSKIRIASILYGGFVYACLSSRGLGWLEIFLLLTPMIWIEWFDGRKTERDEINKRLLIVK